MSWWAWLEQEWYGLSILRWSIAGALLVGIFFLRRLIAKGFSRLLYFFAFRRQMHITLQELETLMQPAWIFLLAIATFYTSARIVRFLHLPSTSQEIIQRVFEGLALLAGGLIGSRLLAVFETILQHRFNESGETYKSQLIHPLFSVARIVLFLIVILLILQHTLRLNVGALFTGLGLGGLAVALAAQETLQHFIGAMVIFTDRPFQIGEVIQLESGTMGTVEKVGLRSTQIRTSDGLLLVVPNKKLVDSLVTNLSRVQRRRVWIRVGLLYSTPTSVLESLQKDLLTEVQALPFILSEPTRPQVLFTNYLDSAIELSLIAYFDPAYIYPETGQPITLFQVQNILNTLILRTVRRYAPQTDFAFPTRTLHLVTLPPDYEVSQVSRRSS
jgi:MscS family membrane protein